MTTWIQLYHELVYIETFDWDLITTTETFEEMKDLMGDGSKYLDLWSELLAKSAIKRLFKKKIDAIDDYILQNITDKNLRLKVQCVVEERRKSGARLNMEVLLNIIERLKS